MVQLYWHRVQRLIHKTRFKKSLKCEILACHFFLKFSLLTSFVESSFSFFHMCSAILILKEFIDISFGKRCILTGDINILVSQLSGQRF